MGPERSHGLAPAYRRARDRLASMSPRVVGAAVGFCFGRLSANPQQIGHALARELSG